MKPYYAEKVGLNKGVPEDLLNATALARLNGHLFKHADIKGYGISCDSNGSPIIIVYTRPGAQGLEKLVADTLKGESGMEVPVYFMTSQPRSYAAGTA